MGRQDKRMMVKLVSDGTMSGTMLVDSETDEPIYNLMITNISFDGPMYRRGGEFSIKDRIVSVEFAVRGDPHVAADIHIMATNGMIAVRQPEPTKPICALDDRWET